MKVFSSRFRALKLNVSHLSQSINLPGETKESFKVVKKIVDLLMKSQVNKV